MIASDHRDALLDADPADARVGRSNIAGSPGSA
jgi:hypothetical protein